MSEIAFLSRERLQAGAAVAGLHTAAADAAAAEERIVELAREGASVIIVTDDLVKGRAGALRGKIADLGAAATLLVVPVGGGGGHLENLRRRFAAALGVDVWETALRRGGGA